MSGMNHPSDWSTTIADYRSHLLAAGRPTTTVYLRSYQLRRLAEQFPAGPWTISADDLVGWFAGNRWGIETLRSWRSMLRTFYRWGVVSGRTDHSPADALPAPPPPRRKARPAPDQIVDQAAAASDVRARLMIDLAARCGLRRGEIARVRIDDVARDTDGCWLWVHGKGGKDRLVPVPDAVAAQIHRRQLAGDVIDGWLFAGQIDGHLSPAHVGRIVTRALPGAWTTHTLRHRYATRVYQGSGDLLATQRLLGHAKPETTQLYVELGRDSLRDAARFAA